MSDFIFKLGMDISDFTKSISEVEAELKTLRESLKTATSQGIVDTNVKIKQLEQSLVDLKKVGLDKLPGGIVNAQNQLASFSGVVRDLPFGFVAIQNNLPLVVDSFTQLSKQSGGVGNAFKSIGAALIGPAGLAFAFGAVISVITGLVQSYGSLGAAITDIFGLQIKQRDLQNSLNSAFAESIGGIAGEVANLKSLGDILTNVNSSLKEKNGAYAELNKQYPGILSGIKQEEAATGKVNEEIAKRIKLFSLQLELEGKADAIRELISKAAKEQLELGAKLKTGSFFDVLGLQLKGFVQTGDAGVGGVLTAITNTFAKTSAETKFFTGELGKVNEQLVVVNAEVDKLINGQKGLEKAQSEAAKTLREKNLKALKEFNAELSKPLMGQQSIVDYSYNAFDKNFRKRLADSKKGLEDFRKNNVEVPIIQKKAEIVPSQSFIDAQNRVKQLQDTYATVKGNLETVFFNPLTDLFSNFFETGKLAFADFGKTILKTIGQIVSKIIATGIINLLASILLPTSTLATVGTKKGIGAAFGGAIKSILFGGSIASPSFAGVGGGSMGMSGQVNVVLRGQDLVGAINRTNSTINRVG